uniref:D-isomer specific 2-hydroxyacid dehydrogenase catalytic domain-containing protein n=1 Tax=Acrobeloides nanus TaxID=290746 RepID=A0A914DWK7_9BILA
MIRIESVLVADEIEQECLDLLNSKGIKVEKKNKLSKNELIEELKNFDAVLVRSATKITGEIIQASAGKLKLIGRAGTGVDNIDVKTATEYGIVVMNTPGWFKNFKNYFKNERKKAIR